jgi:hypothetical protein
VDSSQAKAGPGPFPLENTFTPQGPIGAYVRADGLINSSSVQLISEFNLSLSTFGRATTTGASLFTGIINPNQVITVSFNGQITTSAIGSGLDNIHSSLQFNLFGILSWIPGVPITPGGPDYETGPGITVINETVSFPTNLNTAPFDESGPFSISFTSDRQIDYLAEFEAQTSLSGAVAFAPEPSSGLLLIAGLCVIFLLGKWSSHQQNPGQLEFPVSARLGLKERVTMAINVDFAAAAFEADEPLVASIADNRPSRGLSGLTL